MWTGSVRTAVADDLPAIVAIYNDEVLRGVSTFDTVPWSVEDRREWLLAHGSERHPVVVADDRGDVVGWGALSPWSSRRAYAQTAEMSVYVHVERRARGVGHALFADLIRRARAAKLAVLLARVESSGSASLGLCESFGFERIGTMRRVGRKFGRWLDVELLDLQLDA